MKSFTSEGMDSIQAFGDCTSFELGYDVTKQFHKANVEPEQFAEQFLGDEPVEGYGYYVVLQKPNTKTTKNKYKVLNVVNKTSRKWVTMVNFIDNNEITVFSSSSKTMTKAKAISKAKELVQGTQKTIIISLTKQVITGDPIVATVVPNPDIVTPGRYFFFGTENSQGSLDD
jgi:hypothetical protein